MSAPPQRLSDTSRPITNASTFFCPRTVGAKRRTIAARAEWADWTCRGMWWFVKWRPERREWLGHALTGNEQKTCTILGCGSVSGAANTFSNNSFEVAA